MGSDRARISFDPSRDYRSVVAQQGRVTLEADTNEQTSVAAETLRHETIDIVGPEGTPDDGYKVSRDANGYVEIGPGTMYVGGWRLRLGGPVQLGNQPDWLDRPLYFTRPARELIALLVTEQSISATEDEALREVALGGPDTSARTRLMQHFLTIPTEQRNCPAAEKDLTAHLARMGLVYNSKTAELTWRARLKVSFFPPLTLVDPCCPPAQGGYLGADNQLVRVTVTSYNPASRLGTLLWGWNNASFLYRASLVSSTSDPPILRLGQTPLDAEHTPQPGQFIEVLRTAAVLGNPQDKNYVASQQGLVVQLGTGSIFDSATNQLTLPKGTVVPNDPHCLFVRQWQAEVPFTSGKQTHLDTTSGLAVTVALKALPAEQFVSRPFWQFAVRPNTPQRVYPQRYLQGGSTPDGPRQWLCGLAIVSKEEATPRDCRKHFLPLIDLEPCDCCHLVLDPAKDWLGALNQALSSNATALSVCFQPGQFTVTSKITIAGKSVKMTGAGQGTTIVGNSLEAVLEFDNCACVELSDLSVTAGTAGYSNDAATAGLQGAVTIRACTEVDIERVWLTCANADLRAASCLAVYNPAPAAGNLWVAPQYNIRILNSQFTVGHFQVGILLVNADRAQVEGNLIVTPQQSRNISLGDLSKYRWTVGRLKKHLVHALTVADTAPPKSRKARARLRKKQARVAPADRNLLYKMAPAKAPSVSATPPAVPAAPSGTAAPSTPTPPEKGAIPVSTLGTPATAAPVEQDVTDKITEGSPIAPHVDLGSLGLGRVTATFGTVKLQFITSNKLGNAWNEALKSAGLTAASGVRAVHKAVSKIAESIVKTPTAVAPAFRSYLTTVLPLLYSTSSQGIVVAGDIAKDIRILNNTINGTAQGIHVGFSNLKTRLHQHLAAARVQICGNTITVRVTPETTGDRHGIYLGSVLSAIINDNQLELRRASQEQEHKAAALPGQVTYAIEVIGEFGPRILIERNCMVGFSKGIYTYPYETPENLLWKAADNASPSGNRISASFKQVDNVRP